MDWAGCEFVERVPGKVGWATGVTGTRIEPDFLLVEAELGRSPEQTHEGISDAGSGDGSHDSSVWKSPGLKPSGREDVSAA